MRKPIGWVLSLGAVLILCAAPADAQQRRFFVGAGAIADSDRTNSRLTDHGAGNWTLAFGADVLPHVGIRLIVDAPKEATSVVDGIIQTSVEFPFPLHQRLTWTRRSTSYSVLGDVHGYVAPRLRLAATYGIAQVTHDSEIVATRERINPDGSLSPMKDYRQKSDFPWGGFALGVEANVLVTRRVAIVPEARMIYFPLSDSPDPYIYRAGLGLRWWF